MKMPNGYGSVVKLSGKRRKPWAVRISYMDESPDGVIKRKQKYLAYFVKQESALQYLTEYNNGSVVAEHIKMEIGTLSWENSDCSTPLTMVDIHSQHSQTMPE